MTETTVDQSIGQLALDLWASLDVEMEPPGAIDHKQAVPILRRWLVEHAGELRKALKDE